MSNQAYKQIVFCDFDGTITVRETFVGMVKQFNPQIAEEIFPQIYAQKITLKDGVKQLLESIPSYLYPEILTYIDQQEIRPGFEELLDFLSSQSIPLVIISGGLKDMVERVLCRKGKNNLSLHTKVKDIHALEIDYSGEYLQVFSPYQSDTELVAKARIMQQYFALKTIAIGDGITDQNMALHADLVFARDQLINYVQKENKSYLPWSDFFDILTYLKAPIV
jgi:2-hydroxy-3-keto-5-methylthiopentenyl-1-phosphate phosphatase